jgi:uncharacterized protein (TIGR03382 family)
VLPNRISIALLGCGAIGFLAPGTADAHFALEDPPSWMSQDSLGLPQKLGPCGDEGGGTPTGTVTTYQSGQTITVTVNEIIFHPGHYRISLAVNDRSELPAEPVVTPGSTPCGTAAIENPAVFPVLADDVFDHTQPFTSPQSVQITLPSDVVCAHCTLQVIEFMSEHALNNPGGCFYHHCADLSISAPGSPPPPPPRGCGCSSNPGASSALAAMLFALAASKRRRCSDHRRHPDRSLIATSQLQVYTPPHSAATGTHTLYVPTERQS